MSDHRKRDTSILVGFWRAYDRADHENPKSMVDMFGIWSNLSEPEKDMALKGIATRGTEAKRIDLRRRKDGAR